MSWGNTPRGRPSAAPWGPGPPPFSNGSPSSVRPVGRPTETGPGRSADRSDERWTGGGYPPALCWERLRQGCTKLESAAKGVIFERMASDGKKINLDHICILRACLGGTRPGGGLRPPPGDPWFAGTSGRRVRNLPESEVVWSHFPQKKIRARAILT